MFDTIFKDAVVAGVPLLLFVIGLVQYIKSFGLTGNVVKIMSLAVGVLLGIGYQFTKAPPVDFVGWFNVIIFGLALGLTASGLYDATKA